jgi:formate transporter
MTPSGNDPPGPGLPDAYAPPRIARLMEEAGVAKAAMPAFQLLVLGFLGGVFIALGAMYYTVLVTDSALGLGPTRLLGGVAFSLGLVLIVVGGAELFTGNNLIVMAWMDRRIGLGALLRNWGLVYLSNLVGSLGAVAAMHLSGALQAGGGGVARTAAAIAAAKVALPWGEAFFRGLLCNVLVCLASWLAMGARTISGRIPAIVLPVSAFVALGFEHSVANMYLIPIGRLAGADGVTLASTVGNLVPVTLGNVVGGGVFVALVYWAVYLRGAGPEGGP